MKTIKELKINNQTIQVSTSCVEDVKRAYSYKKDQYGEWVYNVDPENYGEVKSIWLNQLNLDLSIYNVFCLILKIK